MFSSQVILSLLLATAVSAATLPTRQLGGIACNVARLQVVGALGDAESAISSIEDTTTASAAQAGVDEANSGISEIASAIVAGEAPPDSGRATVESGLTAASSALSSGDSYVLFPSFFSFLSTHPSTAFILFAFILTCRLAPTLLLRMPSRLSPMRRALARMSLPSAKLLGYHVTCSRKL